MQIDRYVMTCKCGKKLYREMRHGKCEFKTWLGSVLIDCMCGCGQKINLIAPNGKIRAFIYNHGAANNQCGELAHNFKRGWRINTSGYKLVKAKGHWGTNQKSRYYYPEHILIMEQFLSSKLGYQITLEGRFSVHHRNQDKLDNRIENLRLMTNIDHRIYHNKFKNKQLTTEDEIYDNVVYYLKNHP